MSLSYPNSGPAAPDVSFIGRGFSWPLEVDHCGAIRLTQGPEDLDRSLLGVELCRIEGGEK